MSKKNQSENDIASKKKQAKALTKALARENDVFLDYCTDLIEITLNTMAALGADQDAGKEAVAATAAELKQSSQQALQENLDSSKQEFPSPSNDSDGSHGNQFDSAMDNSMHNAVTAQQQMNILATAATSQLISTIITLGSAEIGKHDGGN